MRRTSTLALLVVSLSTPTGFERSSQTPSTSHPIRQIDHIMIRTGDPRELDATRCAARVAKDCSLKALPQIIVGFPDAGRGHDYRVTGIRDNDARCS